MTFEIKTDGRDQAFFRGIQSGMDVVMKNTGADVERILKEKIAQLAPELSGDLANSYEIFDRTPDGFVVRSTLPYGGVQERRFGYLARALSLARKEIEQAAEDAAKRNLENAKRMALG